MNKIKFCFSISALLFSSTLLAQDQCNITSECKNTYGSSATDCANSKSSLSICMCGTLRCDSFGQPTISYINVPAKIQAEDYLTAFDTTSGNQGGQGQTGNVDIQATTDTGGGLNVGWINSGEWLEYPINITSAGEYQLQLRIASPNTSGTLGIDIDGALLGSTLTIPNTGGWQNWQTISSAKKSLTAGKKMLRLNMLTGGFNINWIDIKKVEPDTNNPPVDNVILGKFNTTKDLLLAHFDQKPDLDDVHAVAALATMLRDSRFNNVKYHAVAGTIGTQGGRYIDAPQLFNLAFGNNWSNASTDWNAAVNSVTQKALATLNTGGDIWVQEAGQSNFTADVLRAIQQANPSINLKTRFHVVQHSNWNEDKTTPADLTYVKNTAQYNKIADGNSTGNGTPGFNTRDGSDWQRAKADVGVGNIWSEAQRVADANNNISGYENPSIKAGGFDFSDCVENAWIFGFLTLNNSKAFFNEFLSNNVAASSKPTSPQIKSGTSSDLASVNWELVENMSDEFNDTILDSTKWQAEPKGNGWVWDGRAPGLFTTDNITLSQGSLNVEVSELNQPIIKNGKTFLYKGAIVRSLNPGQVGWYYEARMKANATEMSSTFWLMTKETDQTSEKKLELDIQECVGKVSPTAADWVNGWDKIFHSNAIHRTNAYNPTQVQIQGQSSLTEKNHSRYFTYAAWWKSPTEIRFYLDGEYKYSITPSVDWDVPAFYQMAIETYDWNPVPSDGGLVKAGSKEERTTRYDWIRTWKIKN